MAFIQCLPYAVEKYREFTGEKYPNPSHGYYPGEFWDNADYVTASVICPSVAIWVDNNTDEGHALFVESYNKRSDKYTCHEANWNKQGETRIIRKTASQIENMYPEKVWRGCVY